MFYNKSMYLCTTNGKPVWKGRTQRLSTACGNIFKHQQHGIYLMEQVKKLVETITKGIQKKKGSNITIADLSGIEGSICHYFIICQGNSPSQVEAITDSVEETARLDAGEKPVHVVGLTHAQWVAMDYTDVMVHIFMPEAREYYNLENLWEDAKLTHVPDID